MACHVTAGELGDGEPVRWEGKVVRGQCCCIYWLVGRHRQRSTKQDSVLSMHPFRVGRQYTRRAVFGIIGVPPDTKGGKWFIGSAQHHGDWFIFATFGDVARTGHDYQNRWEGRQFHWLGKTGSRISQPTIRLKRRYQHRCQICQIRLEIGPGRFYSEAHHIQPLGGVHQGLDREGNMMVLCPNHHAIFDCGGVRFVDGNQVEIEGEVFRVYLRHRLSPESIAYHNTVLAVTYSEGQSIRKS